MADTRNTIRWDSVGADRVKRDYADITAANDKTAAGFQKTGASAAVAGAGVDKLGKATSDYASHSSVAASSTDSLNAGLATFGRLAVAAAAATAGSLGASAIRAADSYKGLQNQLKVAGLESEALTAATNRLFEVSKRTGTSVEANVTLYSRLSAAQKDLGATSGQLFTFTEAVANALKINGTEASAASGALLQLSQAMGGAKIQAQEYNSLIDGMRPLLQAVANNIDAAGGSVAKLTTLVKDGSISTKEFFDAAILGAQQLAEQAEKAETRIEQAMQTLSDSYMKAAGESEALTAAADLTTSAIDGFGQSLDGLFKMIDDQSRPIMTLAGWVGDLKDGFEELTGREASAKRFFEIVGEAASNALNPLGSLIGRVGALQEWLAQQGEWKVSVGRDWEGSVGGFSDKFGGSVPVPIDKPDLPDRILKAQASAAEKTAKQAEDWQGRIADGWRDLYDKVGEASADFNQKISEDARKAADEMTAADAERRRSIEATIEAIAFETEMIGLSNEAKEKAIALRNMDKAGASPDQLGRAGAAIDANQARQAAQDAADEVKAVWDAARDDFSDSWSDLFYGIFNDGKLKFKDLADSIKSIWARTLADLLTLSIQNSFIRPMFDGLFGGMMGTGAAGTRTAIGALGGNSLQGTGGIFGPAPGGVPDPTLGNGTGGINGGFFQRGGTASELLGAAGRGGLVGGLIGGKTGAGLGAVGSMAGLALGPVGSLVGGIFGGILGALFKSTPRSISSVTTNGGLAGLGDSYASGLDIKIGQGMGKSVANLLNEFASELDLSLDNGAFVGLVGQRGKKFFYQSQQSDIKKAGKGKYGAVKFDTAEEAIAAAVEAALQQGIIDGLTDVDKKLLEAASSVQEGMAKVIDRRNFIKELDFQYMGITNPLGEQLARLKDWYDDQLKLAEEYEADKTKLEAVYNAKRKDLIEQYNESLYGGLKDFLTSITAGSASTLSPTTRLGLASANYSALLGKARTGDQNAIGALQGAAQDYLTAGRDVFASSSGYQSIFQQVVADLSAITGIKNPLTGASNTNSLAAAVNDNMRTQITYLSTAQTQRAATNEKLDTLNANMTALVTALSRGSAIPTQNGTVTVGAVDWSSISQAVASLR